jgi:hypothetical protein
MIRATEIIDGRTYYRITPDGNGNSRTVISWLGHGHATYSDTVHALRSIGGQRYRGRAIGGGIVFQESPQSLHALLIERGHIKGGKA